MKACVAAEEAEGESTKEHIESLKEGLGRKFINYETIVRANLKNLNN